MARPDAGARNRSLWRLPSGQPASRRRGKDPLHHPLPARRRRGGCPAAARPAGVRAGCARPGHRSRCGPGRRSEPRARRRTPRALAADSEVQLEHAPGARVLVQLCDERCDADPAGDEEVLPCPPVDREEVDWRADVSSRWPRPDLAMQEQRAASALVVATHADGVTRRLGRRAHERVWVAPQDVALAHLDDDVRAAARTAAAGRRSWLRTGSA